MVIYVADVIFYLNDIVHFLGILHMYKEYSKGVKRNWKTMISNKSMQNYLGINIVTVDYMYYPLSNIMIYLFLNKFLLKEKLCI